MVFAIFLVQFGCCYYYFNQIGLRDRFLKLPSFGFSKGGHFLIRVLAMNLSGVRAYFLPRSYDGVFAAPIDMSRFCRQMFPEPPIMSFESENLTTWEGTVPFSVTVVPFIANCRGARVTITAKLTNPGTFLDSRELPIPEMYVLLTFVYAVLCLIFIGNQLLFPRFFVGLHTCLGVCCVLKAVSCYFVANEWYWKGIRDDHITSLTFFIQILRVCSHTLFFTVSGLAVVGWGSYRDRIPLNEALNIFMVCMCFFATRALMTHTLNIALCAILVVISTTSLFMYIYMAYCGLVSAARMEALFWQADEGVMIWKLELVLKFGGWASVWTCVMLCVRIYWLVMPSWAFLETLMDEGLIFALFVINMVCFLYKSEYREWRTNDCETGTGPPSVEDESVLRFLMEPDDCYFAYMSTPVFIHVKLVQVRYIRRPFNSRLEGAF
jgi:hypothetical protein